MVLFGTKDVEVNNEKTYQKNNNICCDGDYNFIFSSYNPLFR